MWFSSLGVLAFWTMQQSAFPRPFKKKDHFERGYNLRAWQRSHSSSVSPDWENASWQAFIAGVLLSYALHLMFVMRATHIWRAGCTWGLHALVEQTVNYCIFTLMVGPLPELPVPIAPKATDDMTFSNSFCSCFFIYKFCIFSSENSRVKGRKVLLSFQELSLSIMD